MTPANPQAQDSSPASARDDVADLAQRLREARISEYDADEAIWYATNLDQESAAALEAQQAEIRERGAEYLQENQALEAENARLREKLKRYEGMPPQFASGGSLERSKP